MALKKQITVAVSSMLTLTALAGGAQAATISTDYPCYDVYRSPIDGSTFNDPISVSGSGFTPFAPFTVATDGVVEPALATDIVATDGTIGIRYSSNSLSIAEGAPAETHQIDISDGISTASTTYSVSNFEADIVGSGNLLKKKVRFKMLGFGQASTIYAHYLDPKFKLKKTVKLGTAQGVCGDLTTKKRKALPVKKPRTGLWTIQIDTQKTYDASNLFSYILGIRVSKKLVKKSVGQPTKLVPADIKQTQHTK